MSKKTSHDGLLSFIKFGHFQLLSYFLSSVGMLAYFSLHLTEMVSNSWDVFFRVNLHGYLEILLLLIRTINEVIFGKIGFGDVLHHLSLVVCFMLVLNVASCKPYGWLICHMQALHCPLFFWYLGCRQNSFYESSKEISSICKALFPPLWYFAVGYRCSIMVSSVFISIIAMEYFVFSVVFPVFLLMLYLDSNWTSYFMGSLSPPSKVNPVWFISLGIASGILSAFYL